MKKELLFLSLFLLSVQSISKPLILLVQISVEEESIKSGIKNGRENIEDEMHKLANFISFDFEVKRNVTDRTLNHSYLDSFREEIKEEIKDCNKKGIPVYLFIQVNTHGIAHNDSDYKYPLSVLTPESKTVSYNQTHLLYDFKRKYYDYFYLNTGLKHLSLWLSSCNNYKEPVVSFNGFHNTKASVSDETIKKNLLSFLNNLTLLIYSSKRTTSYLTTNGSLIDCSVIDTFNCFFSGCKIDREKFKQSLQYTVNKEIQKRYNSNFNQNIEIEMKSIH